MADRNALDLVAHTRELYAAILRARAETPALVLKDMGDAIFDAVPWEDIGTPVKQALVAITRELMDANTEKAIREIRQGIAEEHRRPEKETPLINTTSEVIPAPPQENESDEEIPTEENTSPLTT